MTIAVFVLLVFAWLAATPAQDEVLDCQGEWDDGYVDKSDDIGEIV